MRRIGQDYESKTHLSRLISVSPLDVKAVMLRVALESYLPFITFRERFTYTQDMSTAARQVKELFNLAAARDAIKDTLVSLGTYTQAFVPRGGGQYQLGAMPAPNDLILLSAACDSIVAAEQRIRAQTGLAADIDRTTVLVPLADALMRARNKDSRGAVVTAGNAIESYLLSQAAMCGASMQGANGINSKLDRYAHHNRSLPPKLIAMGKYLGNVRNAADHGTDAEIGLPWTVTESTGVEFVYVACSFIAATFAHLRGTLGSI